MDKIWENLLLEIGFLILLGFLYYFYQRRKIIQEEERKSPMIMGYILHSILTERGEQKDSETDALIEAIDDFLHNKTLSPPIALLKLFAESKKCSPELRDVILEGLSELD